MLTCAVNSIWNIAVVFPLQRFNSGSLTMLKLLIHPSKKNFANGSPICTAAALLLLLSTSSLMSVNTTSPLILYIMCFVFKRNLPSLNPHLFLDPQDEVGPSISSSIVLCFFFLLVYIVVLVLVVCLCPSSVHAVATFPGTVLFPLLCSVLPFFSLMHWFFSLSGFVIPSKCLKNFICAASKRRSSLFFSTQASAFFLSDRKLKSIFVRPPLCCVRVYKSIIIWTEVAFIPRIVINHTVSGFSSFLLLKLCASTMFLWLTVGN